MDLITDAIALQEIRSTKQPKALIEAFIAAMIGTIVRWKFDQDQFNIVEQVDVIFDTIYE